MFIFSICSCTKVFLCYYLWWNKVVCKNELTWTGTKPFSIVNMSAFFNSNAAIIIKSFNSVLPKYGLIVCDEHGNLLLMNLLKCVLLLSCIIDRLAWLWVVLFRDSRTYSHYQKPTNSAEILRVCNFRLDWVTRHHSSRHQILPDISQSDVHRASTQPLCTSSTKSSSSSSSRWRSLISTPSRLKDFLVPVTAAATASRSSRGTRTSSGVGPGRATSDSSTATRSLTPAPGVMMTAIQVESTVIAPPPKSAVKIAPVSFTINSCCRCFGNVFIFQENTTVLTCFILWTTFYHILPYSFFYLCEKKPVLKYA